MLHAESRNAREQRHTLFPARALSYAALSTLYDVHACIEGDEIESVGGNRGLRLELQQMAIDGFKRITAYVADMGLELEQYAAAGSLDKVSPMVCFPLQTCAGTYAWYARENGNEEHLRGLAGLRRALDAISPKWEAAGMYNGIRVPRILLTYMQGST